MGRSVNKFMKNRGRETFIPSHRSPFFLYSKTVMVKKVTLKGFWHEKTTETIS